jgi:hypothetical protein
MNDRMWNPAQQTVTCKTCERTFVCTPWDDYYNATCATDGVCEPCLLKNHYGDNVPRMVVVDSEGKEVLGRIGP